MLHVFTLPYLFVDMLLLVNKLSCTCKSVVSIK